MHHKLIQSQHRKSRVAAAEGLSVFPLISKTSSSRQQVSTMNETDTQSHWLWVRFNHVYHASCYNKGLALRRINFLTPSCITAGVIPGKHRFPTQRLLHQMFLEYLLELDRRGRQMKCFASLKEKELNGTYLYISLKKLCTKLCLTCH